MNEYEGTSGTLAPAGVTSNQRGSKGHDARMDFLDRIKNEPFMRIYGRGIQPVTSKWDVLNTSKYVIAYENFRHPFYWTEKIADAFLSYAMPIYYGCENISQFFPSDAYLQLDVKDKHAGLFLKECIQGRKWERNIEAISEARRLVLDEYQLFPFLYGQIQALEVAKGGIQVGVPKLMHFKGGDAYFDNVPEKIKMKRLLRKVFLKFGLKT